MKRDQFEMFSYSSEDYFQEIERALGEYKLAKNPRLKDVLFLAHALHHLREWISPQRKDQIDMARNKKEDIPKAVTDEDIFFDRIFELDEFRKVLDLSNGAKHGKRKKCNTHTERSNFLKDWGSLADVESLEIGAPVQHLIDGKPAALVFEAVMEYYRQWFED